MRLKYKVYKANLMDSSKIIYVKVQDLTNKTYDYQRNKSLIKRKRR
ncbi:hypothetical protein COSHB9_02500 [Companilactobacillus alimentarius]|nr:hypothetical protein LAL01_05680 [Companilactobacillus alimentarius]